MWCRHTRGECRKSSLKVQLLLSPRRATMLILWLHWTSVHCTLALWWHITFVTPLYFLPTKKNLGEFSCWVRMGEREFIYLFGVKRSVWVAGGIYFQWLVFWAKPFTTNPLHCFGLLKNFNPTWSGLILFVGKQLLINLDVLNNIWKITVCCEMINGQNRNLALSSDTMDNHHTPRFIVLEN